MKKKIKANKTIMLLLTLLLTLSLVAGLSACGEGAKEKSDKKGVTLNVMGEKETFDKVPEKSVIIGYENVQELLALDLDKNIAGITSSHFKIGECLPEYRDRVKKLNNMGKNISFEALLKLDADFTYSSDWSFDEKGIAPISDFKDNDIKYYVVSGSYKDKCTFEDVYTDIENLGKIYHKEDKVKEIIDGMKARIAKVKKNAVKGKPTVFVYDSGDKQAFTACKKALETTQIEACGGKNIFDDINSKYASVSWEKVAEKNPEWILINEYEEENPDKGTKTDFIKKNPALANVDAVKKNHIISINLIELLEGLQCVNGTEKILKGLQSGQ